MTYDPYAHDDDEQDRGDASAAGRKRKFREFDCPECSANNPLDEGFGHGDEVLCNYCGEEFRVEVNDDGRLRLRLN
jgi:transcription elongation factor Elf1